MAPYMTVYHKRRPDPKTKLNIATSEMADNFELLHKGTLTV